MGGMVWYQDKLIVTSWEADADHNVMYIFDMNRILQATVNSSAVGKASGGWSADGYQYVMPAIGSYSLAGGACSATNDNSLPCFGSISLDRSSVPGCGRSPNGRRTARGTGREPPMRFRNGCCSPCRCPR